MHETSQYTIYFGDAERSISLEEIALQATMKSLQDVAEAVQAEHIALLHQNHGVQGAVIDQQHNESYFFQSPGDYLMTQKKDYGIGVVTADCLPIVVYDPVTHTALIIHAGWKGLLAGIFQVAMDEMQNRLGVKLENLEIYLGPAARPCCYEVQEDYIEKFKNYENSQSFFVKKDAKTFFDSRSFIIVIARSLGMRLEKLYTRYNVCTICNLSFCSYRREQEMARRQVTMISLH